MDRPKKSNLKYNESPHYGLINAYMAQHKDATLLNQFLHHIVGSTSSFDFNFGQGLSTNGKTGFAGFGGFSDAGSKAQNIFMPGHHVIVGQVAGIPLCGPAVIHKPIPPRNRSGDEENLHETEHHLEEVIEPQIELAAN